MITLPQKLALQSFRDYQISRLEEDKKYYQGQIEYAEAQARLMNKNRKDDEPEFEANSDLVDNARYHIKYIEEVVAFLRSHRIEEETDARGE